MSNQDDSSRSIGAIAIRYSIGRSTVHTRMKALGIQPEKVGNRAYLSAEQVALLDELHAHIKAGGITPIFLKANGLPPYDNPAHPHVASGQSLELSSGLILSQSDVGKLARAIATEITYIFKKKA